MEVKNWNEYTNDQKKTLVKHWWHYYGKMVITFAELQRFHELVEKDVDTIFRFAVDSFIIGQSSQQLIVAMRFNEENQLLEKVTIIDELNDKEKEEYELATKAFVEMLIDSYNNPEPDVSMDNETLKQQISYINRIYN